MNFKATERFAIGICDTGAIGVSDEHRELLYYGDGFTLTHRAKFLGYMVRDDGVRIPKFGKPIPVKESE